MISSTTKKGNKIAYGNGDNAIVRNLDDPRDTVVFNGHNAKVNVAAFSPNGEWIASGDDNGKVFVWALGNQSIKNETIVGRKVTDISWSEDGKRLAVVGEGGEANGKCIAWDAGNAYGIFNGHSKTILGCAFKPTRPFRVVTAAEDMNVNIYEGPPFKFASKFSGHKRYPSSVRYHPSGNHFVTVACDSSIKVFEGKTGEYERDIESKDNGHSGSIYGLAFNGDGSRIVTVSGDKTTKVWDFASGELIQTFTAGSDVSDMQVGCAWAGDHIISVSLSGAINFWDLDNPAAPKKQFLGHQSSITGLAVDRNTKTAYTTCDAGRLVKWDLTTGAATLFSGSGHSGKPVTSLSLTEDGSSIVTIGYDDTVRFTDAASGTWGNGSATGGFASDGAVFPNDGKSAAVAIKNEKLLIVRDGASTSTSLSFEPTAVAVSSDGSKVVVGGNKKVVLFTVDGGNATESLTTAVPGSVTSIRFSPDGKHLSVTDKEKSTTILVVDDLSTRNPTNWQYHDAVVNTSAWNPQGDLIITGASDQNIWAWTDTEKFHRNNKVQHKLLHHKGVSHVQFLDDATFVSTGVDRCIKVTTFSK